MGKFEGIAAMYMSMPMAQQSLPLLGSCAVDDKKITLKFPISSVSFDLPAAPQHGGKDMSFDMQGAKGDMTLNISYKADMRAFVGSGKQGVHNVLTFIFYDPSSSLNHLKAL